MSERKKKTIVIPDEVEKTSHGPMIAWGPHPFGPRDDGRDVTQPVGYDENGNPLYAPKGITFRVP